MNMRILIQSAVLAATLASTGPAFADDNGHFRPSPNRGPPPRAEGPNQFRPGPPPGARVPALPPGARPYRFHGGSPYYFNRGTWYYRSGPGFIVTRPPIGAYITVLPSFYTTVWFAGVPFYYADGIYYRWEAARHVYVVSDPPEGANATASSDGSDDLFIYPKNGQSEAQQSTDRYECHRWAADQTAFDPTKPGGDVSDAARTSKRDDYQRAQTACLEARGYSVK